MADHAVDLPGGDASPLPGLAARLAVVYGQGAPPADAVERAFASVVRRHRIPRAIPEALLEGFRWDLEGRRYEDLAELLSYCARVGSTVGVMMSLLMDRRDGATLASACDLGQAMQITNIARDVGEDARRGRLYLPRTALRAAGADPDAWLSAPRPAPAVHRVVIDLLDEADRLYARAWPGIGRLPVDCRPAIRAAALLYSEIGREVRRAGAEAIGRRVWTGRATKLRLLARALLGWMPPGDPGRDGDARPIRAGVGAPPDHDAARRASAFLVRAVQGGPLSPGGGPSAENRSAETDGGGVEPPPPGGLGSGP
jgi:phytoene synthase